jgi:hypothetical protein
MAVGATKFPEKQGLLIAKRKWWCVKRELATPPLDISSRILVFPLRF